MSSESVAFSGLGETPRISMGLGETPIISSTKRGSCEPFDLNRTAPADSVGGGVQTKDELSGAANPITAESQAVGGAPVKALKKALKKKRPKPKEVMIAVDGEEHKRLVNLKKYKSYRQFSTALEHHFSIRLRVNRVKLLPTFEYHGHWIAAKDVPWKKLVRCCKFLRIMKIKNAG